MMPSDHVRRTTLSARASAQAAPAPPPTAGADEPDGNGDFRLRKPLYLDAAGIDHVEADGPALRVIMREGADRLFPLARLSRLLVRGPVTIEGEAMLAILEAGLTLTWARSDGTLAGHVLTSQPRLDALLNQRLEDLAETGELSSVLENWRLSMIRQLILRLVAPHLGWLRDLRARSIRSKANGRIHRRLKLDWQKEVKAFRPLLMSLALAEWQRLGVSPLWLDPGPERPDLAGLIAGLMEWPLWHIGLKLRRAPDLSTWKARIAFFERNHPLLRRETAAAIDDLVRHLYATLPGLAETA